MKIGICGTQSTGKSTLAKHLVNSVKEFKDFNLFTERSAYLSSLGIPLNNQSTYGGQLVFLAERASELMCENMIADRTILDVIAFTKKSKQISSEYLAKVFEDAAMPLLTKYDIIFYAPLNDAIKMEYNNVRETDEKFRLEIDTQIRDICFRNEVSLKIPFVKLVSSSLEERTQEVLNALKKYNLLEEEKNDSNS